MGSTPCALSCSHLPASSTLGLFREYLEMVVQFGYATLFVAAFPLGPFFALINNVFEIRIDAIKFTISMRRPVGFRAENIGVWRVVLETLSFVAVVTNVSGRVAAVGPGPPPSRAMSCARGCSPIMVPS